MYKVSEVITTVYDHIIMMATHCIENFEYGETFYQNFKHRLKDADIVT